MNLHELLNLYLKKNAPEKPAVSMLINELLEARAQLKDHEVNNQLLEELVFKYAEAEKQLKQLNRDLLWQQKRIQQDLDAAADIQRSLLPHETNMAAHADVAWFFEPCDKIGGDIFNMIQLDEDHWAIYMLDVSGHGVPAAMVTVSVSQLMQLHSGILMQSGTGTSPQVKIRSPAEVLNTLDREFPFDRFNNFFTINYFVLNTVNGDLNYANAGHPKPVILRQNGTLENLESNGPPIGISSLNLNDDPITFDDEHAHISPGDKVILYTDGLVEYYNENEAFYGIDRFHSRLLELNGKSVKDIVNESIKSLKAFGKNRRPADDITLLCFELMQNPPQKRT
jgi:sigma-B regulation protein RsbU (phosphoserine phosphatase)